MNNFRRSDSLYGHCSDINSNFHQQSESAASSSSLSPGQGLESDNYLTRRNHPRSHSRSFSWSHTGLCSHSNTNSMAALFSPIRVIQGIVPTLTNAVNNPPRGVPSSPTRPQVLEASSNISNSRVSSTSGSHIRTRSDASRGHSRHSSSVEIDIEDETPTPQPSPVDNNGNSSNRAQDQMEFIGTISWLQKAIPFIILLLTRIMWDHRLGILVFIGMFGTFYHVNSTIKKQVALKERRLNRISLGIFLFLFANIFFIYFVFKNQNLENCLILQKPNLRLVEVWAVFWCVGITDFVIRYVTMAVKCLVIVLPRRLINFRKRGKYFLVIEHLSQLYRMVTPLPQWYVYFSNYGFGGEYFALVSTLAYGLLKGRMLFVKLQEVRTAFHCFWKDTRYGRTPGKELIIEAGEACPICQESMEDPIELNQCKHIFCEECIVMWFDRERTCPMCRAKIAEDPQWRDGNTQLFMQMF